MESRPQVVVIGAACMDLKGQPEGTLVMGTSNPGIIRVSPGGAGRNMAENLARLGVATALLSCVGEDDFGRRILERTSQAGVDTSRVMVTSQFPSASYLALLDQEGLLSTAIYDTRITELVSPTYIDLHSDLIRQAKMVLLDGNPPPEAIEAAIGLARRGETLVCADPTSASLAHRFLEHLGDLYLVTPNVQEAEVLSGMAISDLNGAFGAAQRLVALGVDMAVITLAEEGLCYVTSDRRGHIPAIRCEVVDYTGAGAALTATVVFGLLNDFSVDEAVRLGVSAATLTLKCEETVCPNLSLDLLYDQLVI